MAVRNLRYDNDPLLRKKSKDVTHINDNIKKLLDDMAETMYNEKGIGLAAPQVGVLKRIIIIDIGEGLIEFINPYIIESSGINCDTEGCLSLPSVTGDVERPSFIKVKGLDRNGNEKIYKAENLLARVFCHEIDHLNGILFTDKIKNK